MSRIQIRRNKEERFRLFVYGLVGLAESLVVVLSLGNLDPDWRMKLLFSKWWGQ
jgi:hypothetical protein